MSNDIIKNKAKEIINSSTIGNLMSFDKFIPDVIEMMVEMYNEGAEVNNFRMAQSLKLEHDINVQLTKENKQLSEMIDAEHSLNEELMKENERLKKSLEYEEDDIYDAVRDHREKERGITITSFNNNKKQTLMQDQQVSSQLPPVTLYDRLLKEKRELDEWREFLEETTKLKDIDGVQMSLLNIQSHAMLTYSQVLTERISWLSYNSEP